MRPVPTCCNVGYMTANEVFSPQHRATARLNVTLNLQGTIGAGEETAQRLSRLIVTETGAADADIEGFLDAQDRVRAALRELRAAAALLEVAIDRDPVVAS